MANYYAKTRTNYFAVTDEAKLKGIMENADPEATLHSENIDGKTKYMFYCDGSFDGYPVYDEDGDVCEGDFDSFAKDIQNILPADEAIIIKEVGSEKFRYLSAYCTIITKNKVETIDLDVCAEKFVRELLKDEKWSTRMDY